MIETIKDWITDPTIEIHRKGIDHFKAVNTSNWILTTNHRDAIPVNDNSRRFAIFYTAQQSKVNLRRDGLTKEYFDNLHRWAQHNAAALAWYLRTVDLTGFPHVAPQTTSTADAIAESRGPLANAIAEAVGEERPGFRGGFVSSIKLKDLSVRQPGPHAIKTAMGELGYVLIGRAPDAIADEGGRKPSLYSCRAGAVERGSESFAPMEEFKDYLLAQGYWR